MNCVGTEKEISQCPVDNTRPCHDPGIAAEVICPIDNGGDDIIISMTLSNGGSIQTTLYLLHLVVSLSIQSIIIINIF